MENYVNLEPEDLVIDSWSGERQGGWATTPPKGVRIVHRPTGAMVMCDTDRSQHKNRVEALHMLNMKVGDIMTSRGTITTQFKQWLEQEMLTEGINADNSEYWAHRILAAVKNITTPK